MPKGKKRKFRFTELFLEELRKTEFSPDDPADECPSARAFMEGCFLSPVIGLGKDHIAEVLVDTELLPSKWFEEVRGFQDPTPKPHYVVLKDGCCDPKWSTFLWNYIEEHGDNDPTPEEIEEAKKIYEESEEEHIKG